MWSGDYSFFDYKYNIDGYSGQDFDGAGRMVFMLFSLISIPLLLFLFRKAKEKQVDIFLKGVAIFLPVLDISKCVWESYYDVTTGRGFNWEGLLPLYTCSLFIYCTIGAAFGKGKFKDWCLAWVATIGLIGGLSNVILIQGLKWYPFFTFGGMYSMVYHYVMAFTSLFIVVTKYKVFHMKDIWRAMGVHVAFSAIVIPIDYVFGWDYMQYYGAGGIPLLSDLSDKLVENGLRFLTVPMMLLLYLALAAAFTALYTGYCRITDRAKKTSPTQ